MLLLRFLISRAISHARDFHLRYFWLDYAWVTFLLINLLINVLIFKTSSEVREFFCHNSNTFEVDWRGTHCCPGKLAMIITKSFGQGRIPDGNSRLRITHLDHLSLVSDINPAGNKSGNSKRGFAHSFFYRTHHSWNRLPLSLRE